MISFFASLPYFLQAFIAALFTWFVTALGASVVYLFKKVNKTTMDAMLGFSAGVMIAASFFSLLSPAISMALKLDMVDWLVVSIGFLMGGLLLYIGDNVFEHLSININNKFKRSILLIFSITLHNIPEGMAIGVAFGSIKYGIDGATMISALILALGIGIQNFPEGSAISLPLKRDGMSSNSAFIIGNLSGIVEPIFAVIGAILVLKVTLLMPFLLSFAAGAMIYVVVQELIPESQTNERKDLIALFTIFGFIIMMIFDIAIK